jgi:predicted transcriptional regulator
MSTADNLTRREHQVMEAVYELNEATARDVLEKIPDPPSSSAVRAVLTRLVNQGHLRYRQHGPRYVYSAAAGRKKVRQAAIRKLVDTFFDGSPLEAMNALLGVSAEKLSKAELAELAKAIDAAAEKGK